MTATKTDVYQEVTDAIVAALEAGTIPWRKPWSSIGGAPLSMSTNRPYRGVNVWLLTVASFAAGYTSPWWGTYKQISERGGQVEKGARSTLVTFWKQLRITEEIDGEQVKKTIFMLRHYRVFNSEQADWPEGSKRPADPAKRVTTEHERIDAAEAIVTGYVQGPNGPALRVRPSDSAHYTPALDTVTVPEIAQYDVPEEFYSTLYHELIHSTGHSTRLNRPGNMSPHFGSELYAKEELVAELGSQFLSAEAGLDVVVTLPNSAAYLANWLTALRNDKKLIVSASSAAQRAAERVVDPESATAQAAVVTAA